jgi:hypothetical protein
MNLTKKVLAAAVAAVAFSGAANAAIVAPSSGNGDLIIYAWDTVATGANLNKAYAFDTGIKLNTLLTSPASVTFNLSANFASYFGADLAAGLVQFTAIAGDSLSANSRLVSGGTAAPVYGAGATTLNVGNIWAEAAAGGLNPAANGFAVAGTTNEWAWNAAFAQGAALNPGLTLNGTTVSGSTQGGVVGVNTLNLYSAVSVPNTVSGRVTTLNLPIVSQLANLSVSLSNAGVLSYTNAAVSAVPLPAALWLLGSGLFGLIGVGRRRLAA